MRRYSKILLAFILLLSLSACGTDSSDNTDSTSVSLWEYLVSSESKTLSFDKIQITDTQITSTEIGSFSREYTFINSDEVNGSWRSFDGIYSIKNQNNFINYSIVDVQSASSSVSGSFVNSKKVGDFLFLDGTGGASITQTFGDIISSYSSDSGECVLNKLYDTITLYENYSYNNVLEIKCEHTITQKYGSVDSPRVVAGTQRAYEYYQKEIGWIAKVDKDCIIAIDSGYEFIDDSSSSCVKTKASYELLQN